MSPMTTTIKTTLTLLLLILSACEPPPFEVHDDCPGSADVSIGNAWTPTTAPIVLEDTGAPAAQSPASVPETAAARPVGAGDNTSTQTITVALAPLENARLCQDYDVLYATTPVYVVPGDRVDLAVVVSINRHPLIYAASMPAITVSDDPLTSTRFHHWAEYEEQRIDSGDSMSAVWTELPQGAYSEEEVTGQGERYTLRMPAQQSRVTYARPAPQFTESVVTYASLCEELWPLWP